MLLPFRTFGDCSLFCVLGCASELQYAKREDIDIERMMTAISVSRYHHMLLGFNVNVLN